MVTIYTYYKQPDRTEQNQKALQKSEIFSFAAYTFSILDPFNIPLSGLCVPLKAIHVMVYLLAINPPSPIDEENVICHHTSTQPIVPIDQPYGHHCGARVSEKKYAVMQP